MKRLTEGLTGKSGAVVHEGLVYAVAFDPDCADGITAQTTHALTYLDRVLAKAGSSKDRMVQVTIYLSDIRDKPAMDAIWNPWIGERENWPQRACIGVDLDPGYLIEIVVVAAVT